MIKKKIKAFWAIFAIILIIIAVLKASFTISLLLLMAGIGLSLIYVRGIAGKVLLVLLSFVLVCCLEFDIRISVLRH